jgi:myo-inositol-1(or 4)-monophosphatase
MSDYVEVYRQAGQWIRDAGRIARERFGHVSVTRKADRSPVTEADLAVQEALQTAIGNAFPGDAVITEETQADPQRHASVASAARCWVIDPIDGTRNYARALPYFTISVALLVDGSPQLGMVYEPMADRMFHAMRGGGAWCGQQRLMPARPRQSSTLYLTVPTSRHEELPPVVHSWIDRMVVRNFGSTAMHLAYVASGAVDALFCKRCSLWDIAAGALLVTEAGRILKPLELDAASYFPMNLSAYHNEKTPCIAGAPEVVAELLTEYRRGICS